MPKRHRSGDSTKLMTHEVIEVNPFYRAVLLEAGPVEIVDRQDWASDLWLDPAK